MKIAVIGSGIGGLATACRLAQKGHSVTVFEKNTTPGGKIGQIREQGYRFDTGPSLFTLPELVEELFHNAGQEVPETLKYAQLDIVCKYFYNSGERVNAYANIEKFKKECEEKLGENPKNIEKYLRKSSLIYKITADIFIFNSLHKIKNYLKLSVLKSLLRVNKISVNRTMHADNIRTFTNPKIVQLFDRYATYNGSNPYKAPATLNVIAHLENNIGAYFPKYGMYAIAESVYYLAQSQGVQFRFNSLVSEIVVKGKKAVGVKVDGAQENFDLIVANTDVNTIAQKMMKHPLKKRLRRLEPSSSAMVFYWGVKREFPELDTHNILFAGDYKKEFGHLFKTKSLTDDPTVYIFVSSKSVEGDAPKGCENWFVMINVPANDNQNWNDLVAEARKNIVKKINTTLNVDIEKLIEFEKIATPLTIEENTLSHRGALYGNSSNSMFAAFLRHPNFLRGIKNLYFVGGSVHPGGGIPLCLAGANIVDKEIEKAE